MYGKSPMMAKTKGMMLPKMAKAKKDAAMVRMEGGGRISEKPSRGPIMGAAKIAAKTMKRMPNSLPMRMARRASKGR